MADNRAYGFGRYLFMLPNYPGLSVQDPRKMAHLKAQYFNVTAGLMGSKPVPKESVEKQITEHSQRFSIRSPPMTTQNIQTFAETRELHDSVPLVPGVLRFYAYFRQDIPESAEETYRVRYVRIHVYLEDDTVMIEEYRIRNSGMEQGVLLRRMRPLNPTASKFGTQYTRYDFKVGINVEIAGVTYRIYSCDKFTEDYFNQKGWELGTFEEPPDDLYSIKRRLTERPIRVAHINPDKANLKRFLEFDGKVLRFWATWDDTKNLFGEKRDFIIIYFLVDGSIEIRQILQPNSGRDNYHAFLSKTKLNRPDGQPYSETDFYIGATIEAFGRSFVIYAADKFTQDFLDNKYGKHNWTAGEGTRPPEYQHTQWTPPPFNGWGDEEDSLGYCKSLHPKPPRKDLVKLLNKEGQILRFSAQFVDPAPQDRERQFVIAYYLADDTVAVFEKPQRNSGFKEGKFFQRSRIKNPETGTFFAPQDFAVGKEIVINGFRFYTTDADEYALNYMEAGADEFPQADLASIAEMLRAPATRDALDSAFKGADPELQGAVPKKQAESIITEVTGLSLHEAETIARRFDTPYGFDYFAFITALK